MAKRTWFPRDCNMTADPKTGLIGAEYGAEGVLAFEELLAVAKLEQNGGRAELAYSQLAGRAFIRSAKRAREILHRLEELGLVELMAADDFKVSYRLPSAAWIIRRERLAEAGGFATEDQIRARVDYYGGRCWVCGEAEYEAMDHVKPVAAGGAGWPSNLRPICKSCNSRKGAKWPYFARRP